MDKGEHASIDMEKLADTLEGKINSLHPLSKDCSIYRVPERSRCLNPNQYTPQMVSIGPLHHGKKKLKAMEDHKVRYLNHFLQRTHVSVAEFLTFIKESENKLRNCYSETIHFKSDEFVKMIFVDAVFIIEFFLRFYEPYLRTDDDRIFGKPKLHRQMRFDLLLVENQLPLFILNDLFDLAKTRTRGDLYEQIPFAEFACAWLDFAVRLLLPIKKNLIESNFFRAEHFLDLLILGLQPAQPHYRNELVDPTILGAKELHQAGVKFESMSSKNLLDIEFNNNGILEIPFFTVYEETEVLWRNLLAFENMHCYFGYFNDYIVMMGYLISGPKDAELFFQNKIVGLGDIGRLVTVFNHLRKGCYINKSDFKYSGIVSKLQDHCQKPRNKWKAVLKQNYFNTPWASISVIAAVILLLLTVTQTICSIIAL